MIENILNYFDFVKKSKVGPTSLLKLQIVLTFNP
jgi:hypothetical protein